MLTVLDLDPPLLLSCQFTGFTVLVTTLDKGLDRLRKVLGLAFLDLCKVPGRKFRRFGVRGAGLTLSRLDDIVVIIIDVVGGAVLLLMVISGGSLTNGNRKGWQGDGVGILVGKAAMQSRFTGRRLVRVVVKDGDKFWL